MSVQILKFNDIIRFLWLLILLSPSSAFSISDYIQGKRVVGSDQASPNPCPTWHPFQCPTGECISIKYLCDDSADCSDGYDENSRMCTAANRPPVEETASFLKALLQAHGNDFLGKIFGVKAKNGLKEMGGIDKVAVALSQSPSLQIFCHETGIEEASLDSITDILSDIMRGTSTELTANEMEDLRFFVQKLQETGFF
uniref:Prohormone-4 n=1 Tax=Rhabditophanes sp. KR3021 TaxID=114890 RepID=A0AC35TI72_9BILA